jgi:hypothetical protein
MQWYKHDSDASNDAKIKKLLIKHGAVGYAIYFHCLELIAGNISESNITFELEHDSEIIADNLKIKGTADLSGRDLVESIMRDIIDLRLFEEKNGHIFCFKMLKRLDTSMTSSPKLRHMITEAKQHQSNVMINHDNIMTASCKNRIDEKRKEEIRTEKNGHDGVMTESCENKSETIILFPWDEFDFMSNGIARNRITDKEYLIKEFPILLPLDIRMKLSEYFPSEIINMAG